MEQVAGIYNQLPRAHYLFMDDEDYGRPVQPQKDVMDIVSRCFKKAKKLKSAHTMKIMTQLTTVAEYVKLHTCYLANNHSIKPCTNAGLGIAWCMGKDKYFSWKIHENEQFLVIFHHQKHARREASGLCLIIRMSFKRFIYTSLHKSLAPSPQTFSVNKSMISFFPPWNSPKKRLPYVSVLQSVGCKSWDMTAKM